MEKSVIDNSGLKQACIPPSHITNSLLAIKKTGSNKRDRSEFLQNKVLAVISDNGQIQDNTKDAEEFAAQSPTENSEMPKKYTSDLLDVHKSSKPPFYCGITKSAIETISTTLESDSNLSNKSKELTFERITSSEKPSHCTSCNLQQSDLERDQNTNIEDIKSFSSATEIEKPKHRQPPLQTNEGNSSTNIKQTSTSSAEEHMIVGTMKIKDSAEIKTEETNSASLTVNEGEDIFGNKNQNKRSASVNLKTECEMKESSLSADAQEPKHSYSQVCTNEEQNSSNTYQSTFFDESSAEECVSVVTTQMKANEETQTEVAGSSSLTIKGSEGKHITSKEENQNKKQKSIALNPVHETKETKKVQSLFDIKMSKYLFPRSEDFCNSKMDIFDGVVWEKEYIKHVLYHGNQRLPPIDSVASAPFTLSIVKNLQELNFRMPTCMQRLVWPAVLRGRNVVEVAPSQAGKGLAYLIPILSQLINNQGEYDELPCGVGPLTVILCSNWKKAQVVYNQCKFLLQNCDIEVHVVYTKGYESSQKIALLNGCKVLIITLSCYLCLHREDKRMLNLDRCCHLVLHDADKIIDKFLLAVVEIMKEFVDAVSCRRESFLPNQIVLSSEHWSKQISNFVYSCIPDPLIIMIAFDEAAIYAQVPTFCHVKQFTSSELLKLIRTCEMKKVVVCTCHLGTAKQVYESLLGVMPKVLVAHGNLTKQDLAEVGMKWKQYCKSKGTVILVCSDDVILQLEIKDANCLIHCDLPQLPNFHFGLRYNLMSSNFNTLEKTFSGSVSNCVSHIFIHSSSQMVLKSLLKFLRQLPCEIPSDIVSLTEEFKEEKEYKNIHICHRFKAFGICPSQQICPFRHRIDQGLDNVSHVPRYGWVKIFITNVVDATHYYARILEHSDPCCELNRISYLSLTLKMSDYYCVTTNHTCPMEIKVGGLYALQKADNTFHRIWVTRIGNDDVMGNPQHIVVHYVDEGWWEEVVTETVYVLPPDLARLPAQAIEIYACNVQPADEYYEWTPEADLFIYDTINEKEVEGKVVLGFRNTLWLDPIVYYVQTKVSNVTIVQAVISDVLIRKEFGIKNSGHLSKLYSACEGIIKFPEIHEQQPVIPETQNQQHAFLELNTFHDVYIYSVQSPDLFFVQRTDFIECMDTVSDRLNEMISKGTLKKPERITKDMVCAAPFSDENSWFRAVVNYIDINRGEVDLFFVDYGDTSTAKIEDIYCIPSELLLLPFQAIECSLAGVVPCECNWTEEATKLLYALTCTETTTIRMIVKALKREESRFREGNRYVVQLWDTTSTHDVYVADELIKQGVALPGSFPDMFDNENDKQLTLEQSETHTSSEEGDCEDAFLTALVFGQIYNKIGELIMKENNEGSEAHIALYSSTGLPEATTKNCCKNVTPQVKWCQTDDTVSIRISVTNLKRYEVNIIGLNICFLTVVDGITYRFEEELYDLVQPEACNVTTTSTSITLMYTKEKSGKLWPRLTKRINENIKLLKVDGKTNTADDSDDEQPMPASIIKWDPQDVLPYDPSDEYDKENLSEDDIPWEQVCCPLDPYDMLCWD